MYISNYLKTSCKGHANFDFVDVNLNSDNCIFIDPCLIECGTDLWSIEANKYIQSFFDCLFNALKNDRSKLGYLLSHGREQNATKLGYGNGSATLITV